MGLMDSAKDAVDAIGPAPFCGAGARGRIHTNLNLTYSRSWLTRSGYPSWRSCVTVSNVFAIWKPCLNAARHIFPNTSSCYEKRG